jgi:Flp pilus assembly protein TadD
VLTVAQCFAQAVAAHQAGRLPEAEALYRRVLEAAPGHPHALHLLGVLTHQLGRHPEAVALINQALAAHGPHPVFHSNLAAVHLAQGDLAAAEAQARAALRLDPTLADAHNNLGVALRRQERFEEAEGAFRAALRLNPRHSDARSNLGAVLQRQDRLAEALACLEEAARLAPAHAQTHNDLGGTLIATGQAERAVRHLQEALRLRPHFAEAHNNLGLALRDLNRLDEALDCFRRALDLEPGYAGARNNLGYTLEIQGKIDEALAEFHEALRRAPDDPRALANLSKLAATGHYHLTEEEACGVERLAAGAPLPLEDRCRLHFALAALRDKTGDHDAAFSHCRRGNELRQEINLHRGIAFDVAAHRQLVDRLGAAFTPAYFERVKGFGLDDELPVFIVGMPRSGTTLAEQILASHPQVHGAGELGDISRLVGTLPEALGTPESYPECVARLDAARAGALAREHVERLRQLDAAAARVVDKMPFNFLNLGLLATLFPKARIIHCRRDPRDTCLSCFFQNFGDPQPFALDLRHLGQYYREYERLMEHWARVLPVPLFELHYEELTTAQEEVSRRLVAFCGLEWDERCLRFHDKRRTVRTASVLQVRQPMYRTSVGRWKHYEAHLGPLLEELQEGAAPTASD